MDEVQEHSIQAMLVLVGDELLLTFCASWCNALDVVAVWRCALFNCVQHNERRNVPASSEADVVHVGPLAQASPLGTVVVDAEEFLVVDGQMSHACF